MNQLFLKQLGDRFVYADSDICDGFVRDVFELIWELH